MNSLKDRLTLARACDRYLLACPMAGVFEIKIKGLSHPEQFKIISDNLEAREFHLFHDLADHVAVVRDSFESHQVSHPRSHC